MKFYKFLKNEINLLTEKMVSLYVLSGIIHFFIILVLISSAISVPAVHLHQVLLFSLLVYAFARVQKYTLDQSSTLAEQTLVSMRLRIIDIIRRVPLRFFETLDKSRVITILTQESMNLFDAVILVPRLCSSAILFCAAFLYIAVLSVPAFLISLFLIVSGIYYYRAKRAKHETYIIKAREHEDRFFALLNHLLGGYKELKINTAKSTDFFDNYLAPSIKKTEELKLVSATQMTKSIIFAQLFGYSLLAFLLFIFPEFFTINSSLLVQVVTIILFITTGPLQDIVGSFPLIERADIAVRHIKEMENELREPVLDDLESAVAKRICQSFESLQFCGVSFRYDPESDDSCFQIGPIDFQVNQGEIIFIMGGNGAGKTTFLKVLLGLYPHTDGTILWNGCQVDQTNRVDYQSNFSIVFQDVHLFDRVYGTDQFSSQIVSPLLQSMQLEQKTSITEDGIITNLQLSAGQRKRLALAVSQLENKDIFVFDEWAAEQDPHFRQFFYEEYLQDLKRQGKTIIAVTHDDKYYGAADRIYCMEYGILSKIR